MFWQDTCHRRWWTVLRESWGCSRTTVVEVDGVALWVVEAAGMATAVTVVMAIVVVAVETEGERCGSGMVEE